MSAFYDEMAEVVLELLGPGEDSFGEPVVISRAAGTYDSATRKRGTAAPLEQTCWGTPDTSLAPASLGGSLTSTYERVLYAAPASEAGFAPAEADRCAFVDGGTFVVMETAHVIKDGTPILWICGLKSA